MLEDATKQIHCMGYNTKGHKETNFESPEGSDPNSLQNGGTL